MQSQETPLKYTPWNNPWFLTDRQVRWWLAIFNVGFATLVVLLPPLVSRKASFVDIAFLTVFVILIAVGFAILKLNRGWFISTVGDYLIVGGIVLLLASDISLDHESTSYEIAISIWPGVVFASVCLLVSPSKFLSGLPHTVSLVMVPVMAFGVVRLIVPFFGVHYVEPHILEAVFGAFFTGGFIVRNMRKCYVKTPRSMNNVSDSIGDNTTGFIRLFFDGKISFSYPTEEDIPMTLKVLNQLTVVLDRANALKGEKAKQGITDSAMVNFAEELIRFGPDNLEGWLFRLLGKVTHELPQVTIAPSEEMSPTNKES